MQGESHLVFHWVLRGIDDSAIYRPDSCRKEGRQCHILDAQGNREILHKWSHLDNFDVLFIYAQEKDTQSLKSGSHFFTNAN